ncbi:uncharacterized protein BDCG_16211 [Blastomyces dermatitidis ER-3]|uniref:Uncharacterized protein n=1 Tax=Ajellomyces dermatitidis (strain ER-3 / ATCC MYA-2586) TaxID=559297 RepID=A0ABX2VQP2_AJEDR|nr:uncharacterized protein BDCG_16211 [Blastomyces dermatitidis ER-3]OAS99574.1 hypothetical protein BDCG_16211 [Blastomyces dermatitidis ER-3]
MNTRLRLGLYPSGCPRQALRCLLLGVEISIQIRRVTCKCTMAHPSSYQKSSFQCINASKYVHALVVFYEIIETTSECAGRRPIDTRMKEILHQGHQNLHF